MSNEEMKIAVLAGAAFAINYIEKNRGASGEEAMRNVSKDMKEIIRKIQEDD